MRFAGIVVLLLFSSWAVLACEGPSDLTAAIALESSGRTHNALGAWFAARKQYPCAVASFEAASRIAPAMWEAHFNLALALMATGRAQMAEEHLRVALPLAPNSAGIPFHLGQSLILQRRYTAAVPYLQQAVQAGSSTLPARLALGAAFSGSGQSAEALKIFQELVASYPDSAGAYFNLGNLYAKQEQYSEASGAYAHTLKLDPANDPARLAGAKALMALSLHEAALPLTAEYLSRHPQDAEALYLNGLANRGLGRYRESEAVLLRAAALTPGDYNVQYNLGFVQEKLEKFQAAREHLEQASVIRPEEAGVHFHLASVFRGLADEASAKKQLEIFQSIKDREKLQLKAEFGTNSAQQLLINGDAAAAAHLYREALKFDPNNANTLFDLSLALNKLGDHLGERVALEKAVALNPQFKMAHNQLGLRHMEDGRLEPARKQFQSALEADPQFAEARSNLGVLSSRQGKHSEAEKMFRQAAEDDPKYVKARVNLALILAAQGHLAAAEKEIEQAIQADPADKSAQSALSAIQAQLIH